MIRIVSAPVTAEWHDEIAAGINAAAARLGASPYNETPVGLKAMDGNVTTGHLTGKIVWEWLYIDLLYVDPAHQHRGIGTQLMQQAEALAREKNLAGIYCWTQSWQAPGFYKKLGYQEFTQFENFPPGHTRVGFRKALS